MVDTKEKLEGLYTSFYKNIAGRKYCDMTIGRVLNGIRIGAYSKEISQARVCLNSGDKDGYDAVKKKLPAVTFCGTFASGHSANEYNTYNNIMVIDIDKLDDEDMSRVKDVLTDDPYVAAFWESPSGMGYKGLVSLSYADYYDGMDITGKHRIAFQQIFTYLLNNYGIELDKSGKDICRLCFMSADNGIVVKDEFQPFKVEDIPELEQATEPCVIDAKAKKSSHGTKMVNAQNWSQIYGRANEYRCHAECRSKLTFIYKKLKRKGLSITESWEDWVKVAYAIASSVHPEKGREIFLMLCRLDGDKHDEAKSEHLIFDAYTKNLGHCNFGTIIYLARQKGIVLDR